MVQSDNATEPYSDDPVPVGVEVVDDPVAVGVVPGEKGVSLSLAHPLLHTEFDGHKDILGLSEVSHLALKVAVILTHPCIFH